VKLVLERLGYTVLVAGNGAARLDVKAGKVFISKPFTERALSVKLREAPPPETLPPAARQA
jgi:hypothetical protein